MNIKTQSFLVLGVSKSGFAVAEHILSNGGKCYIYEQLRNDKIQKSIEHLITLGAILINDKDADVIINLIDVVVISPGVPLNHELAVKAKKIGKRIIGELEYGFLRFTPPIIAVTGTNGKTTTVTLIDDILSNNKTKSCLVGNVGVPLTQRLCEIDKERVVVAEVSSFQLETISDFCPHISCVINIKPDHLERHYTMENYIFLKKRIFKNQKESEYTVLNFDDKTVRSFFTQTKGKVVWVSLEEQVEGAYRKDGKLYFYDKMIIEESRLRLKGEHNTCDALFAIACASLMGIDEQVIVQTLENFKGIRHRIEYIAEKAGITYYNDSKATNTASTISALETMSAPTILILGGSEKGEKYEELFEKIKQLGVKHVILTGASRFNMLNVAGKIGYVNLTLTANFEHAVKIASMIAQDGDNVLLSPSCASFDSFNSYQERGDAFRRIVEEIKE